jgi:hypothetical protein
VCAFLAAANGGGRARADLTPGNILVDTDISSSPANTMYEYTTGGVKAQSFTVQYPAARGGTEYPRDGVVGPDGNLYVYNGTFSPYLTVYDPVGKTFVHRQGVGFSTANNVSYGGVAVAGNYAFVTDQDTAGSTASGLVRFDLGANTSQRFRSGTEYEDVTLGLDGLIYALKGDNGLGLPGVDVLDPQTMAVVRNVALPTADIRGVVATAAGELFAAGWDGKVYHYSAAGSQLGSLNLGAGQNLTDIDLSSTGRIVVGGRFGDVFLTDTSLSAPTSFSVGGNPVFVAFTTPVPEPAAGGVIVALAGAWVTRRRAGARRAE